MGEIREAYSWFGLDADAHLRHAAGQGARRRRRLGRDRGHHARRARALRPRRTASSRRTAPSTRRRSTSRSTDALGREWQTATIQVDRVMLPERFDLWYIDEAGQPAAAGGDPPRDLRLAGAVHRRPDRALRRRLPALVRAGPGRRHPDRRPPRRAGPRAGGRPAGAPGCGSRWTPRTAGCRTRSGWPRSRRCRTCSSSATARSRRGRRRRGRAAGDQQPAEGWEALADRLAAEAAARRPD